MWSHFRHMLCPCIHTLAILRLDLNPPYRFGDMHGLDDVYSKLITDTNTHRRSVDLLDACILFWWTIWLRFSDRPGLPDVRCPYCLRQRQTVFWVFSIYTTLAGSHFKCIHYSHWACFRGIGTIQLCKRSFVFAVRAIVLLEYGWGTMHKKTI